MRQTLSIAVAVAFGLSALAGGQAFAKSCHDATGKFVKCPAATSSAPAPAATPTPPPAAKPKPAPTVSTAGAPAGATAKCKDGTYSMSKHHSGTCSHHGGVSAWL